MRCAAVTEHDPAPDLEQPIEGGSGIGEGDASVGENRHPLPALEINGSEAVVDEVSEGVVRVARRHLVEIDDEASTGCCGQTEWGDVVQNRVTRPDCEHPMDEVPLSHEPERTKPGEPWEDLDNGCCVPYRARRSVTGAVV